MKKLSRMLRNLYIEWQWSKFCRLNTQAEAAERRWLDDRSLSIHSPEYKRLTDQSEAIRKQQRAIARRIGLSEHSVGLSFRKSDGPFPPPPAWIMAK